MLQELLKELRLVVSFTANNNEAHDLVENFDHWNSVRRSVDSSVIRRLIGKQKQCPRRLAMNKFGQ